MPARRPAGTIPTNVFDVGFSELMVIA